MTLSIDLGILFGQAKRKKIAVNPNTLAQGKIEETYTILAIETEDAQMKAFLFSLGCYVGEEITLVSKVSETFVVAVKDARYSIDAELAQAIIIR